LGRKWRAVDTAVNASICVFKTAVKNEDEKNPSQSHEL
jgi:hypothetical protein